MLSPKPHQPTGAGPPDQAEEAAPSPEGGPGREWRAVLAKAGGWLELTDDQGRTAFGLRLLLPTPLKAETLEGVADLAEDLAGGELYFNQAGEAELLLASEDLAAEALKRAQKLGLAPGECGARPNQVNHCPGLLFCHRAAVDTLGPALAVTAILEQKYFAWPALLTVSLAGCPRRCEADLTADLLIEGRFLKPPRLNHAYLNHYPNRARLASECPGQALSLNIAASDFTYFNSLELDEEKCLVCGRCGFDQAGFVFQGGPEGAAFNLYLGGRRRPGLAACYPRLAREGLANNPPHWPELAGAVAEIAEDWQMHAKPRERLAEYVGRLGWPAWLEGLGWPVSPGLLEEGI